MAKKIKRLTKFRILIDKDDQVINEFKSLEQEFDENQNLLRDTEFVATGEMESASVYQYNEQNQMTGEVRYFEKDEIGEAVAYKLNDEGKPHEIITTYADGGKSIKSIHRTERMITIKIVDEEGDSEGEEIVKFDNKGRTIEEIRKDEDGEIEQQSEYEYDDNDQIVKSTEYGPGKEFLATTLYEYDENGNLTRRVRQNERGELIQSLVYDYDENNNQVLIQNNHHQMLTEYDEQNRVIKEESINRVNNMTESFKEYGYNEDGLLMEERSFEMGESYQMEPGVFARTGSNYWLMRYEYEFFES